MIASELPRAVLFDWDNTLVDNWESIRQALNATLEAHGMAPWSLAETRRRVARSARDGFPALFGDRWEAAQAMFHEHFTVNHLDRLTAIDGAESVLAGLRREGIWLGVVSNKRGDLLRSEAEHLGWSSYFGRIVGAMDAPEDKPSVAPVEMALEGSGVGRGSGVWFVGDGAIDMECARKAGCVSILFDGIEDILPGLAPEDRPDYRVADHKELAALVDSRRDPISTVE